LFDIEAQQLPDFLQATILEGAAKLRQDRVFLDMECCNQGFVHHVPLERPCVLKLTIPFA
jgi:hypothetical protein